jgi:hypothetical protein
MPFYPSKKWTKARTTWRHDVLRQIRDWVQEHGDPYDRTTHNVVVRRLDQLERLEKAIYPDAPPEPYAAYDAAAMIILPRKKARWLAHGIFQHQRTVVDDWVKKFNLDWFTPKGFK